MSAPEHLQLDEATVAAARDGDLRACEAIYRQFERPVYTLALRMCANPDDAMDVMQNTFIHALERLAQFRGDGPFWPWLKQVAVTQSLMRLRKERMHRLWPTRAPAEEAHFEEHVGEEGDLSRALARLPDTARAVVWLYDVEGYTHAEIGRLMGRSESFSKSRLARAHAQLRQWLEPGAEVSPCISLMEQG